MACFPLSPTGVTQWRRSRSDTCSTQTCCPFLRQIISKLERVACANNTQRTSQLPLEQGLACEVERVLCAAEKVWRLKSRALTQRAFEGRRDTVAMVGSRLWVQIALALFLGCVAADLLLGCDHVKAEHGKKTLKRIKKGNYNIFISALARFGKWPGENKRRCLKNRFSHYLTKRRCPPELTLLFFLRQFTRLHVSRTSRKIAVLANVPARNTARVALWDLLREEWNHFEFDGPVDEVVHLRRALKYSLRSLASHPLPFARTFIEGRTFSGRKDLPGLNEEYECGRPRPAPLWRPG